MICHYGSMTTLNALLRLFFASAFALIVLFCFKLGLKAIAFSALPACLAGYFGVTAWRVWKGTKPATSSAALIVCGLFMLLFGYKVYYELYLYGGSRYFRHGSEGSTQGNLGALRSALSIYYGDTEGGHPADLRELTVKRGLNAYISDIPKASTYHHPVSNDVQLMTSGEYSAGAFSDAGGWAYVVDGSTSVAGKLVVNCTHTDTRGRQFTSY